VKKVKRKPISTSTALSKEEEKLKSFAITIHNWIHKP